MELHVFLTQLLPWGPVPYGCLEFQMEEECQCWYLQAEPIMKVFKFDIGEGRSEVPDEKLHITRTNWAKKPNNNKNTIFVWKSGTAKIIIIEHNWVCGIHYDGPGESSHE